MKQFSLFILFIICTTNSVLAVGQTGDTSVKSRNVAQTFMLRGGFGLYTPMSMEVNKIGGTGFSFASSFQIGTFLDNRKTVSFSTTIFMAAGEFKEVHYPGARLFYSAYGFNTKWDYHWLRWTEGSLYSGTGVGFLMEDFEYNANTSIPNPKSFEDGANMSFQLDAIGIQFAPYKHFGLFAELGLGYEGVLKLGWQVHW